MFKKITALMIVIFMMMTFTAGCSGSEDKPAESVPEEVQSYSELIFDTAVVHKIDVTMSEEDRTDQLANPVDKTKYKADVVIDGAEEDKVDTSGILIKDMGSASEAASR